jgi:hypothetical protein
VSKIDQYKSNLGYGVRNNLYSIKIQKPMMSLLLFGNGNDVEDREFMDVMIHDVNLPKQRELEVQSLMYWNEKISLPKTLKPIEDVTIKFRNDDKMWLRSYFEAWISGIKNPNFGVHLGTESTPLLFKSKIYIQVYSNDLKTVIREVLCDGAYPISVSSFSLSSGGDGTITETDVVFSIDWVETINIKRKQPKDAKTTEYENIVPLTIGAWKPTE